VSEKLSSAPRVTTATTAPSVRETPSGTIFMFAAPEGESGNFVNSEALPLPGVVIQF
jgi:hypothetical protein